jgi:hypothetical protein
MGIVDLVILYQLINLVFFQKFLYCFPDFSTRNKFKYTIIQSNKFNSCVSNLSWNKLIYFRPKIFYNTKKFITNIFVIYCTWFLVFDHTARTIDWFMMQNIFAFIARNKVLLSIITTNIAKGQLNLGRWRFRFHKC